MSPTDPFEYSPTPHLIFITFFIVFPLIYLCGRITFWVIWQLAMIERYLLFSALRWLYYDDYVQEEILADLADKEKKPKTTTIVRETTTIRRTTRILPKKRPYMNGHGQIALKHPQTELATTLENEEEDTTEFEEELRQEEGHGLRHSPTEDEDESLSTEHPSQTVPEIIPIKVRPSNQPPTPETDSGTEGHFEEPENFQSRLPNQETETQSLHINDPNEFPPLSVS